MSLKERGAITGIGETAYSRNSGKSVVALQMEAALAAIADAGLAPTDIDGIIAYAPSGVVAEDFVTNFGIPDLRFSATTPWAAPARSPPCNAPSRWSRPASAVTS
jgi:acetyl-CoA acetyltransferase